MVVMRHVDLKRLPLLVALGLAISGVGGPARGGSRPARPEVREQRDPDVTEEEVVFESGGVKLAGTLLLPARGKPVPAAAFVHGAAYHERGDNRIEARHFARKGIAALIYDKRGCGASGGDWTRASEFDLAADALAGVRLLRKRPDIDPRHVGLWGMSQGASTIPLAAVHSADVAFLIAVSGCLSGDEQMYYYRANLFRKYELPDPLLDVANKASLVRNDLAWRIRNGLPAPAAWREQSAFDIYHDYRRDWSRVRQPVLAAYGEHDQAVPVAESVTQLRQALTEGGNEDWTIIIYPDAGHTLDQTNTGDLFAVWQGYVPGFLDDVTDWVHQRVAGNIKGRGGVQKGSFRQTELRYPAARYEGLYWFGNSLVQLSLFIGFSLCFFLGVVGGPVGFLLGKLRPRPARGDRFLWCRTWLWRMLSILNLVLLLGLTVLVLGLGDQRRPVCPAVLRCLPLGGSLSAVLTALFLSVVLVKWRGGGLPQAGRWHLGASVLALALFVPFLLYWNLLGLPF
jgi:dienelactone hydrolase